MSPAKKTPKGTRGSSRSSATKKTAAKKAKKTSAKATASKKTSATKKATRGGRAAGSSRSKKKATPKKSSAKKAAPKKTSAKKKTAAKKPARATRAAEAAKRKAESPSSAEAPKRPGGKIEKKKMVIRKPLPKAPPARKPRPAKLDAETLAKIRAQLEGERGDLLRQAEELEEDSFEGSQSELTGEVGLDEDFADAGTATFDRERDLSIRNNIRDLIEQIDRALSRIEEGTYGTCERCGQPIDAARLKALPHASLCLDCKRRDERVR